MLSLCPLSHAEVKVPPKRYSLSKQLLWFPVPLGTWVERSPGMSYFPPTSPTDCHGGTSVPFLGVKVWLSLPLNWSWNTVLLEKAKSGLP